jgi:hypothetical protein
MGKAVDSFLSESDTAQALLAKLGVKAEKKAEAEDVVVPPGAKKVPVVRAD